MKKFLIKVNGNQYEVEVEEVGVSGAYTPMQAAPVYQSAPQAAPVAPAAAAPTAPAAPAAQASPAPKKDVVLPQGARKVNAPMPGTILRVDVSAGDTVKKGQVLLILEAMKMENEIVAPQDGTIASVHVDKGSSVNSGDVLVSMS